VISATAQKSTATRIIQSWPVLLLGLPICAGILVLAIFSSIAFGAANIQFKDVWDAIFAFNPESTQHLIIRTLRVPRAAVAALVGASLSVAGALMQGVTRNPLADPGILGIQTGASLAVVLAVSFLKIGSLSLYAIFAFIGAGITALVVYSLGSIGRGGTTPLKLTIAGAAITALLSSMTSFLLIFNQKALEEVRFWLAGSVAGRNLDLLAQASPYLIVGLIIAISISRQITTLSLGDDVAKGLGQNTTWVKATAAIAVVLLAGASTAVAGPIGFIGLVIPHIVRFIVGVDYRWIIPYCILIGSSFLVFSDVVGRLIMRPSELPVGIMTAFLGGPFFIYLVRWRIKR
jgi:iron complex transport system permease protein